MVQNTLQHDPQVDLLSISSHPKRAILETAHEKLQKVVSSINEKKEKFERIEKVRMISQCLEGVEVENWFQDSNHQLGFLGGSTTNFLEGNRACVCSKRQTD